MDTKQDDTTVEQVREKLKDNKRALEALDFLEEKNRQYRTKKRYTYIFYLVTAIVFFVSMYLTHRMSQNNCGVGACLFAFVATVGTAFLISIQQAILDTETERIVRSVEINFINDLMSEYATYEDFPLIKAGEHYYIDLPDGMREVSPESVSYDGGTKMTGREYRYKNLYWDSKGFSLQEITDVKVCSTD